MVQGRVVGLQLLAYARGVISSRGIERLCRDHVIFIALSGHSCPHFTTIAAFISRLGDLIGQVFKQVLLVCNAHGLIGREMFAIDGVKLPSNASKLRSGTRADFIHQADNTASTLYTPQDFQFDREAKRSICLAG